MSLLFKKCGYNVVKEFYQRKIMFQMKTVKNELLTYVMMGAP